MKSHLLIPFALLLFPLFTWSQEDTIAFFEGEVRYDIGYQSLLDDIPSSTLYRRYGDRLITKIKKDKYLMIQSAKDGSNWTKSIHLLEEGIGYMEYEEFDTIYQYSLEESSGELLEFRRDKTPRKVILGDSCESVFIRYFPRLEPGITEVQVRYYFHPKYRADPRFYKKHKISFWNLFIEETGAISLRNEVINYPRYKVLYKAEEIIEQPIEEKAFEINPNKTVVKLRF